MHDGGEAADRVPGSLTASLFPGAELRKKCQVPPENKDPALLAFLDAAPVEEAPAGGDAPAASSDDSKPKPAARKSKPTAPTAPAKVAPCTLHPAPCNPAPDTTYPTLYTLHPTPCTLHPTPSTRNPAGTDPSTGYAPHQFGGCPTRSTVPRLQQPGTKLQLPGTH